MVFERYRNTSRDNNRVVFKDDRPLLRIIDTLADVARVVLIPATGDSLGEIDLDIDGGMEVPSDPSEGMVRAWRIAVGKSMAAKIALVVFMVGTVGLFDAGLFDVVENGEFAGNHLAGLRRRAKVERCQFS